MIRRGLEPKIRIDVMTSYTQFAGCIAVTKRRQVLFRRAVRSFVTGIGVPVAFVLPRTSLLL